MANEAKQFTINGLTHDVMDVGARQLIADLQSAINAITSGDTTTAIKTFQEVIDFLDGVTDDTTLIGKLNELRTLINAKVDKVTGKGLSTNDYTTAEKQKLAGLSNYDDTAIQNAIAAKYTKPSTGIPASDLASDVIPDISGKANSADVYTKAQTDALVNVPIVDVTGTGSVSQTLAPNTFYRFGSLTALTLTLTAGTGLVVYAGRFTAGADAMPITLPSTVKLPDETVDIANGNTYEFSIADGVMLLMDVTATA